MQLSRFPFLKSHMLHLYCKNKKRILHWTNANCYGQFLFRNTRQNKDKNLCSLHNKLFYQKILISLLLLPRIFYKRFYCFLQGINYELKNVVKPISITRYPLLSHFIGYRNTLFLFITFGNEYNN